MVLVFAHFAGVEIRHRTVLCLARGHTAHEVAELVSELGNRTLLSLLRTYPLFVWSLVFWGAFLLAREEGHWLCWLHALARTEWVMVGGMEGI